MSHELLVVAGAGRGGTAAARSSAVQRAAALLPGAQSHDHAETATAAAALVTCSPAGGGAGSVRRTGDTLQVAVGVPEVTADPAAGIGLDRTAGAEGRHVVVTAGADGTVEVRNDGVGMIPVFWALADDQLLVSTHLASLVSLGAPPAVDELGLLEYLTMLHPIGERTVLAAGRILPAGGTLTWRPGGPAEVTSTPIFLPSSTRLTDDEAVAEFRELWPSVIAGILDRHPAARTAVSLSGGLDSRAVAATVSDLGAELTTFTYGSRRNRETRIAALVADRVRLPHLTLPVTDDRLLADAVAETTRLDGAHTPAELYDTWFLDAIRAQAGTVINGHAGGPLWGDEKAHGLTGRPEIMRAVWSRYAGAVPYLQPYLADAGLAAGMAAAVQESILDSLRPWDFAERSDQITFWQVANRQTRWGNMMVNAMRRGGVYVETPFLDGRFLEYLTRLRPEHRRNGRLYLRIHREAITRTADIPRSDDGNPPAALTHLFWTGDESFRRQWLRMTAEHPVSGLRRGGRRATGRLAAVARARTGVSYFADVLDEKSAVFPAELLLRTRPVYADRLAAMLRAGAEAGGVLKGDVLADAADAVAAGRPTAPPLLLARVATAALWTADFAQRHRAAAVS
ncbi:asparagine synthetase B family protein [Jiangella muralis]|uniref:asparagine synthase-related protein n=1 Tax=Jiangella muralis TaxID=702383 RepID=UPI00069EA82E|nr:asparagine synthetase B family protein [Jiangella muralis]